VHPRQTHVPRPKKQPGNHLVSEGKPWSRRRSKDHVAMTLTTWDNGPFRPYGQWPGSKGGVPTHHASTAPSSPIRSAPPIPNHLLHERGGGRGVGRMPAAKGLEAGRSVGLHNGAFVLY
jgi:hypothetical protein